MRTSDSPERVLTIAEVADYLRIPKATVYKLVREKKIPGHKVVKHWRFIRDEVDDWLSTH